MIDTEILKNNKFVVVDIETTGLSPKNSTIIEIGAVKIENGKFGQKFSTFCACESHIPSFITNLTGICDSDLLGAPCLKDCLLKLNNFCKDSYIVGHNIKFDLGFLNHYGLNYGVEFNQKFYDTVTLSRKVLQGKIDNHKLDTVANYYNLNFRHHRALDDAIVTGQIFLKLLEGLV